MSSLDAGKHMHSIGDPSSEKTALIPMLKEHETNILVSAA